MGLNVMTNTAVIADMGMVTGTCSKTAVVGTEFHGYSILQTCECRKCKKKTVAE